MNENEALTTRTDAFKRVAGMWRLHSLVAVQLIKKRFRGPLHSPVVCLQAINKQMLCMSWIDAHLCVCMSIGIYVHTILR